MTEIPQPRSLEELHNRATSYEIVATDGTRSIRLGFTNRPNRIRLLTMARQSLDAIDSTFGVIPDDAPLNYAAATGWRIGPIHIRKSGRTERDLACEMRLHDSR